MDWVACFDLDETLIDREQSLRPFLADQYASHIRPWDRQGRGVEAFTSAFLQFDRGGYASKQSVYEKLVRCWELPMDALMLLCDFRERAWMQSACFPGARTLLQELRSRGFGIGIITNGRSVAQRAKIRHTGLDTLVDEIWISEEQGVQKPSPAIFQRASTRFGLAPERCWFVGDNPMADIRGAHACGWHTVWCDHGRAWPDHVPCVADWQVATVDDIDPDQLDPDLLLPDWREAEWLDL
jgi:putative hydrolase of the HAD superfamily